MASFRIEYEPPRFAMPGQSHACYQKSYSWHPPWFWSAYWYVHTVPVRSTCTVVIVRSTCICDDTCDVDGDKVRLDQVTCIASARCYSVLLLIWYCLAESTTTTLYIKQDSHSLYTHVLVRYTVFSARHKEAWAEPWPWIRASIQYEVRSFFVFFVLASRQARMGSYEYYVWEDQVTILDYWNCSN